MFSVKTSTHLYVFSKKKHDHPSFAESNLPYCVGVLFFTTARQFLLKWIKFDVQLFYIVTFLLMCDWGFFHKNKNKMLHFCFKENV